MYIRGEPLLRGLKFFEQAIKYQKQYVRENTKVCNSLQTNGYMLDEEWCRFFSENNFLLGISLDGIKLTHDKFRHTKTGEGSYDKIKKNIVSKLQIYTMHTSGTLSKLSPFFIKLVVNTLL